MNARWLLVAGLISTESMLGQGQVHFLNFNGTTVDALVFAPSGDLCDESYLGQLYAGPDVNSLQPVGNPVAFLRGGIISGGNVNIPTVTPAGGPAAVQLRAWYAAYGATWEEAITDGPFIIGESDIVNLLATGNQDGSPPSPPVDLVGLKPFNLHYVPEPSALNLLPLGLAARGLARLRRRLA